MIAGRKRHCMTDSPVVNTWIPLCLLSVPYEIFSSSYSIHRKWKQKQNRKEWSASGVHRYPALIPQIVQGQAHPLNTHIGSYRLPCSFACAATLLQSSLVRSTCVSPVPTPSVDRQIHLSIKILLWIGRSYCKKKYMSRICNLRVELCQAGGGGKPIEMVKIVFVIIFLERLRFSQWCVEFSVVGLVSLWIYSERKF